jgi:RNA polymerase sigma-70 factor (ECF subfamily)
VIGSLTAGVLPARSRSLTDRLAGAVGEEIGRAGECDPPRCGARSDAQGEARWVRRAQAGDEEAFRRLVERHAPALYTLAVRVVRSPEDAEEVVQDSFLRAWAALGRFRGESSFATWLYRIATRCALDRLRRNRRRQGREASLETVPTVAVEPSSRGGDRATRDRFRLERLVGQLPETERAVVTLFYLCERSVREVALALDRPVGTVKTDLRRARGALRRAWRRELVGETDDALRRL